MFPTYRIESRITGQGHTLDLGMPLNERAAASRAAILFMEQAHQTRMAGGTNDYALWEDNEMVATVKILQYANINESMTLYWKRRSFAPLLPGYSY